MTKAELRKLYLSKRVRLADDEYRIACDAIVSNFFKAVDLGNVHVLHCFLPIEKNKEPDTWLIIEQLQWRSPGIRISIPKVAADDNIVSYYYEGRDQLADSNLGIPEPAEGEVTEPSAIDVAIVPLVAFDKRGQRVGYGKGFYDRFLKTCRPDCIRAGLSLFPPEEKIDDIAPFDQPLTMVITPESVYRF